jgi:shikimate 5-dehydrogenase
MNFQHQTREFKSIDHMTIGIIGAGGVGTAFARALARAGIEATISNSRGPDSLEALRLLQTEHTSVPQIELADENGERTSGSCTNFLCAPAVPQDFRGTDGGRCGRK